RPFRSRVVGTRIGWFERARRAGGARARLRDVADRTISVVDVEASARAWIDAWTRSWRAKDPELLAPLYASDAVFRSHPFRTPEPPLDYARSAYAEEEGDAEIWMGEPIVSGERAVVEWWAVVIEKGT